MSDLNIRQRLQLDEERLSPYAVRSARSKGRIKPEPPCALRTDFQRDRDRIIYSKAFRRLKHKTQVFIAPQDDHYVTRLTHTLEVSQISRTIARALNLNEDLTEAIALGHDLGHTPFGHMGERVLNELVPGGFHHNKQSLRVVDFLEKQGQGLNLTIEVRDGILNHSKGEISIFETGWNTVATLEGQIVKISDLVAYINHDIEDAIRARVISSSELPASAVSHLGDTNSRRINTLVTDIVMTSLSSMNPGGSHNPIISISDKTRQAADELRDFLFARVYYPSLEAKDVVNARKIIEFLYAHFIKNPDNLPPEYNFRNDPVELRVSDYIAGMTDHYAILTAENLGLPADS